MKISDILNYLGLEFVLRNDQDYDPAINIASLDIDIINGNLPTNVAFHAASTPAQLRLNTNIYTTIVSKELDAIARQKNYDNALTCISYLNSNNATWQAEAQAFNTLRDAYWNYLITNNTQVENETIPPPSVEDFLLNAPQIQWP